MHIPSARVYDEMKSAEASFWYVPANEGKELALLIKAPTSSIKALIAGCPLKLVFGKKDIYLCTGILILDMPDSPVIISRVQREFEEHNSLIRALKKRKFSVFLFNEMDVCLAWTNVDLAEEDEDSVLNFIGEESQLYIGPFTNAASHALDCFCFTMDNTNKYTSANIIPIIKITAVLEQWRSTHNYFVGIRGYHNITIDNKDEGVMFERTIWASLESVFPMTLYKNPQVKVGTKVRELTDVFSFYTFGSFLDCQQ